jgi:sugar lactone lactonase YvrE
VVPCCSHSRTCSHLPSLLAAAQSDTAFVLRRAGVIPENIVYDAPRDRWLGGDLEKDGMIELRRNGSIRPFAEAAGIDGRVLGLKTDTLRNLLWGVAFTRLPQPAGDTTQAPARSIIFALELPGGRLVRRIASPEDGASHLFNDLVVGGNGAVYFTDSEAGAVWALAPKGRSLRLLHRVLPERFAYPNASRFCRASVACWWRTGKVW